MDRSACFSEALCPLRVKKMFIERGFAKLEIGLCKGKKLHDKRETIKKKDIQRELDRYK